MKQCCALMRSDGTMVEELWFAWHGGDEAGVSRGKASWRDGDGAKLADHVFLRRHLRQHWEISQVV